MTVFANACRGCYGWVCDCACPAACRCWHLDVGLPSVEFILGFFARAHDRRGCYSAGGRCCILVRGECRCLLQCRVAPFSRVPRSTDSTSLQLAQLLLVLRLRPGISLMAAASAASYSQIAPFLHLFRHQFPYFWPYAGRYGRILVLPDRASW